MSVFMAIHLTLFRVLLTILRSKPEPQTRALEIWVYVAEALHFDSEGLPRNGRTALLGHHDFERLASSGGRVFFRGDRPGCGSIEGGWLVIGDRFIGFVEADTDDLADSLLLHGDTVQDIRHTDGPFVVGNDDELRMFQEALQDA